MTNTHKPHTPHTPHTRLSPSLAALATLQRMNIKVAAAKKTKGVEIIAQTERVLGNT